MATFTELVTDKDIMHAINDLGFTTPTEIQAATIPLGLNNQDIIGQAKTGSGKTLAFGIPILHKVTQERVPQAVVIAPTRELCQQIATEMQKLAKYKRVRIAVVYGGVGINPQIDALRSSQIVVATPGRLLDHLERGTFRTQHVNTLVLDEADRMFDMGFIDDIEQLIRAMPQKKQMLLFSATMPDAIKRLISRHVHQPHHIKTQSHVTEELLPQSYYVVDYNRKFSLLIHLVTGIEKSIIFCGTRRTAEAVAKNLKRHNIPAEELHGGLSQSKRNSVMEDFRKGKIGLLIATDVAARGLDVRDVTHVINYDVPRNPEDYTHRIGRTARAGKSGEAITILEQRDFQFFQGILDIVPKAPVKLDTPEFADMAFRKDNSNSINGGGGGFRPRGSFKGHGRPRQGGQSGPKREFGARPQGDGQRKGRKSSGGWKQSRR